jgi:hypothetical protein
LTTLTIQGVNFTRSKATPKLYLGGYRSALQITALTDTEINALLPLNVPAGSYVLSLVSGHGDSDNQIDEFFVTLGAVGPQGPQGLKGETGPVGSQGPIGPVGVTGATGAIGPTGNTGNTGAQGLQGPQGVQGPVGATGATGAIGAAGSIGPQGVAGPAGATGPAGANGANGPQGVAGPQGATGAAGSIGPQGVAGVSGYELVTSGPQYVNIYSPPNPYVVTPPPQSITVSCPAGKKVLGGGADTVAGFSGPSSWIPTLSSSSPTADGRGWQASGYALGMGFQTGGVVVSQGVYMSVWAICATPN